MKVVSIATLDKHFSIFIRTRDSKFFDGKAFVCPSCDQIKPYEQADCGHYVGRQHYATRWEPKNCMTQCRFCNRFNEGEKGQFRITLVKLHGEDEISRMEGMRRMGRKPKPFECVEILARIKSDLAAL